MQNWLSQLPSSWAMSQMGQGMGQGQEPASAGLPGMGGQTPSGGWGGAGLATIFDILRQQMAPYQNHPGMQSVRDAFARIQPQMEQIRSAARQQWPQMGGSQMPRYGGWRPGAFLSALFGGQ